jgi:hypothetical protein
VLFAGLKTATWASILVLTGLRIVLYTVSSVRKRRLQAALLIAGGSALVLWAAVLTHWARAAGARLDALFVAEAAVALLGVWVIAAVSRMLSASARQVDSKVSDGSPRPLDWLGTTLACAWGVGTLGTLLLSESLRHTVEHITHGSLLAETGIVSLVQYVLSSPAIWIVAALVLGLRLLRWRYHATVSLREDGYDIEGGLTRVAEILNRAIEGGIHKQIIASSVQLVLSSAQFALRVVEGEILEGSIRRLVHAVTQSGQFARQTIEDEGLEGLLRRIVRAVLAAARRAQALHTGKLRYNLAWVVASLVLALLIALFVPPW